MSRIQGTVHRILTRNAQLRHRIVWKPRGGRSEGRSKQTLEEERNSSIGSDGHGRTGTTPVTTTTTTTTTPSSSSSSRSEDVDAGRDQDLLYLLSLASEEELEHIVSALHSGSIFSPVVKSVVMHGSKQHHGYELKHAPRSEVERYIEGRFRFLAADALCIIREGGMYPTYREVLERLRRRLRVDCRSSLDTPDLEMEVFLHLLSEGSDGGVQRQVVTGDGEHGVSSKSSPSSSSSRRCEFIIQKIQTEDVLPALAKTAATVALTRTQWGLVRNLGSVVMQRAAYHRALAFVHAGSAEVGKRVMVERAKQRLVGAVVEYTSVRTLFSFVGPLLWASTACDLLLMSLGTDYARLAKTVALLAQVRLLHTSGWVEGGD